MICPPCREQDHAQCPGGTWCPCQHRGSEPRCPEPAEVTTWGDDRPVWICGCGQCDDQKGRSDE